MNIDGLIKPLQQGPEAKTPLKTATEEFEGMFITYLLKVMRSTVESEKEGELSMGKDLYMDLFDQEIALTIARNRSMGIGDMMYRQLRESGHETGTSPLAEPTPKSPAPLSAPVEGRLSSAFGIRNNPITGSPQFHQGIDIAAAAGTPFRAASDGTVVFAGMMNGYGNTVIVDHGGGSRTLYGHAAQVLVKAGDVVKAEQSLGLIGSTGRSTGPHLHFETAVGGQSLDPTALLMIRNTSKVQEPNSR
jgi:murein DD-endopeptidase MepM/ murein hydrolase activator NlpD